jgi:hypothetical protein
MRRPGLENGAREPGHWEVQVTRNSPYQVVVRFGARPVAGKVRLSFQDVNLEKEAPAGAALVRFDSVRLPVGGGKLEARITREKETTGVMSVEIKRLD